MALVSVYLSVLSFTSHLPSALLFVLSLPDPGPSLQTMGFGIYDLVSDTYPESYPQRAPLYLKLSLCSFIELSEHSLKDLVLRHCNSLFNVFNVHHSPPQRPFHLSIFLLLGLLSLPSSLLRHAVHLLENRRCFLDRNTAL